MKKCLLVLFAFFCVFPAIAQNDNGKWNVDLSILAGTNFSNKNTSEENLDYFSNSLGEFTASASYRTSIVKLNISAGASAARKFTENTGVSYTEYDDGDFDLSLDGGYSKESSWKTNLGAALEWNPGKGNTFNFFLRSNFAADSPKKYNITTVNTSSGDDFGFGNTTELVDNLSSTSSAGVSFLHKFDKPGRELSAGLEGSLAYSDKCSEWILATISSETDIGKIYRITPVQYNGDYTARVGYVDKDFLDIPKLDFDVSVKAFLKTTVDHQSAANCDIEGKCWVDSTSYRENFDFSRLTLSPKLRGVYSVGIWKFDLAYNPELALYKLDSDSHKGDITKDSWAHLYDCSVSLLPWTGGEFRIAGVRTISRPSYLQTCWFIRSGSYVNEYYVGNPDLLPSSTYNTTLGYKHDFGVFSTSLTAGYKHEADKIESIITNDDIEGVDSRIYTWINGGKADNMVATLTFGWNIVRSLKASVTGNYNYFVGTTTSGSVTRNSDFNVSGEASFRLKTWSFLFKGRYQSKIIRSYSEIEDVVGCDVRIDKSFKHFDIFLDCRDIFDKPVLVTTYNEDKSSYRAEQSVGNKRIFLLGLKYKF